MLLELAIGDAYGAPFEFAPEHIIKTYNDGRTYHSLNRKPGIYTDDTQMSIAIAEHILGDCLPTQQDYVAKFLAVYKRDRHLGYSRRITQALTTHRSSNAFLNKINSNANSNGCVMRTVPLGLYADPKEVIHRATVQATTTHASLDAVAATVIIALTAHYFYHQVDKLTFNTYVNWISQQVGVGTFMDVLEAWNGESKVPCDAKITASACIHLLFESKTLTSLLKKSIAVGGDVDSVAAVSLGLGSLKKGMTSNLSQKLYSGLEKETYGSQYLYMLDAKLFKKFPRNLKTK